jgi:hypothetical protein
MRSSTLLRIASVLTFLHAVLHTAGGVFGSPAPGAQQTAVSAMKANQFVVMGFTRSFWDFYLGMGLGVSIFLTVTAIVFWQLGGMAKTDAWRLRPLLATFLAGYIALAVISYKFFFTPPVITELLIALCLGLAIARSASVAATQPQGIGSLR